MTRFEKIIRRIRAAFLLLLESVSTALSSIFHCGGGGVIRAPLFAKMGELRLDRA